MSGLFPFLTADGSFSVMALVGFLLLVFAALFIAKKVPAIRGAIAG